jgi:hypothetical protein
VPGAAVLAGRGTLAAAGTVVPPVTLTGAAALSGSGLLTAAGIVTVLPGVVLSAWIVRADTWVSWPPGIDPVFVRHGTVVLLDPADALGLAYGGVDNLALLMQTGAEADHSTLGN